MSTSSWADGAVDETIGSSQDRATIAAFEAAHDGEAPTNGTLCTGRLTGVDTGTGAQYWKGWFGGQNATTRIVMTSQTGDEPDGINDATGSKALVQGYWYISENDDVYMDYIGLEHDGSTYNLYITGGDGEFRIIKSVFRDSVNSGIYSVTSGTVTVYVGGCLFKALGTNNYTGGVYNRDADATFTVINCTFTGCGGAVGGQLAEYQGGTLISKNCALVNANSVDVYGTVTETTNKSEDDGEITNTDADDFTEPSTEDFTVYDTNSALYQAGTSIADSWFTDLCATDFAGTAWAGTPSVGCFEFAAAGVTVPDETLAPTTQLTNSGGMIGGIYL